MPLPPQDAEVLLEVDTPHTNSISYSSTTATATSVTPSIQSFSQADLAAQSARLPSNRCAVLITQKNSFGTYCLYDEDSIPSMNDPEDQSVAGPLSTHGLEALVSQTWPNSLNPFETRAHGALVIDIGTEVCRSPSRVSRASWRLSQMSTSGLKICVTSIGPRLTINWAAWRRPMNPPE